KRARCFGPGRPAARGRRDRWRILGFGFRGRHRGRTMILIRHGESEFNAVFNRTRIDPGIEDPKLTARGRDQAREAAAEIARTGHPFRRVITSPYTRALETATIVAEALKLPVEVEPIVHEHACWVCDIGSPVSALTERW